MSTCSFQVHAVIMGDKILNIHAEDLEVEVMLVSSQYGAKKSTGM